MIAGFQTRNFFEISRKLRFGRRLPNKLLFWIPISITDLIQSTGVKLKGFKNPFKIISGFKSHELISRKKGKGGGKEKELERNYRQK